MIREKQNINDLFTRIGLIILFFIIISAFSDKSIIKDTSITQQEIFSDLQSNNINAIVFNSVQLPDYHKGLISINDKYSFRFSDIRLVKFSDNTKTKLVYLFLQKLQFKIKPKLISRFYFFLCPLLSNSRELPVLS